MQMGLKIKTFLVALLLALIIPLSSGLVEDFKERRHPGLNLLYKDGIKANWRKLFAVDFVLDYEDTGPSKKHSKNPGKGP